MTKSGPGVTIIGGGLAGCEAAWQLANQGVPVRLFEMKPLRFSPAHRSPLLAELVCSNSLRSNDRGSAVGLLKEEMRILGSIVMEAARQHQTPAGKSLAVDRDKFSQTITDKITHHPLMEVIGEDIKFLLNDQPLILATGPLTTDELAQDLGKILGTGHLHFYDAIAPIVYRDSLNRDKIFRGSRYGHGGDDYLNCPMQREEYEFFYDQLLLADQVPLHAFEEPNYFEGCLPIEIMAQRGRDTLRFGPMKPVGLPDPRTGRLPYAVVQLRQENQEGTLFNLVGFQTKLKWKEQERVFRMIPGLEKAELIRYGQMHRNTYICSPRNLNPSLQFKNRPEIFFAGQITGVEGYLGNIATGLLAGWNAARRINSKPPIILPETTMLGALIKYITEASIEDFQPMKANFGIMPVMDQTGIRGKRERAKAYSVRAQQDLSQFLETTDEYLGR